MNDTFSLFIDFLRENRETIKNDLLMSEDSWRRVLYRNVFDDNYYPAPQLETFTGKVSATDSTEFIRELYNGKKLLLMRAYTVLGKKVYPSFISKVLSVSRDDLQSFTIMLMEHSEHMSILEMLKHERPDYILVDGSLGSRVYREFRQIEAEGYPDFSREYITTLGEMLDTASARGIPVIFMAKSSESKLLRRYLLGILHGLPVEPENLSREEALAASDHFLVKSMANSTGYTVPLLQSIPKLWASKGSRASMITTHILPKLNDLPIKVDIFTSTEEGTGEKPIPTSIENGILNLLFWGYGDLKTHNIWLADVDRLVKFRNSEVENVYMKAFEREIGINFYETRGERRARIRI